MESKLKKLLMGATGGILFIFSIFLFYKLWETNEANEIMVVQAINGELTTYTDAGIKWQGFGRVTKYNKSFQYWFDGKHTEGGLPIPIKFNDGGHATIPGSVRVDMPLSDSLIKKAHIKYGSQEAIENQLISSVLTKSIYMSGPTMTSKESYAEKKNELLYYVEDQASRGIYKTHQEEVETTDQLTQQKKQITVVKIVNDSAGPVRLEKSLIAELGINLNNLSFGDFEYDKVVKDQIATQQQAIMQVQTAIAKSKEAEQQALTIEQQGKAAAADAKWKQETIKAQAVTEAEQNKEVAKLNADAEEQNKRANILKGEGEAAYKRLVTQANNNFDKKAETWLKSQEYWSTAFANYKGSIVPQIQTGGNSNTNGATMFMEMMGMKAAKDLGVDMQPK